MSRPCLPIEIKKTQLETIQEANRLAAWSVRAARFIASETMHGILTALNELSEAQAPRLQGDEFNAIVLYDDHLTVVRRHVDLTNDGWQLVRTYRWHELGQALADLHPKALQSGDINRLYRRFVTETRRTIAIKHRPT